jgi:phage replication initiation protein
MSRKQINKSPNIDLPKAISAKYGINKTIAKYKPRSTEEKLDYNRKCNAVIVDHLAFTVPLSSFKHLDRAGKKEGFKWAKLPRQSFKRIKDDALRESAIEDYQAEFGHICFERFKQFIDRVMGLRLSANRDKGLHGYRDSYRLLAKDRPVELGFVGFGGNNNTIYVQVSGEGCQHLFDHTTPFVMHFWLAKVLCVQKLARLDLAYDDFHGNFDADYAEKAYEDEAFKNPRGGSNPQIDRRNPRVGKKQQGETVYVGTRKSNIFWRIYDKAAQKGLHNKVWWRNEVELKKISTDALEIPAKTYAGLNRFACSLNLEHGTTFQSSKQRASLDFAGRIQWARNQVGRTLSDIVESLDGDIFAAFGLLVDERGGKFSIPESYAALLQHQLNEVTT